VEQRTSFNTAAKVYDESSLSSKVKDLYETLDAVIETEIHTTVYVAKRKQF
jgi:hypothetical protein